MGGTHHLPPCFLLGKGWATHPSTSLALSPIHNPHKFSSPSPFLHSHWSHLGPGTMTSVYSLLPHVLPPLYSTSHTMPECSFLKANNLVKIHVLLTTVPAPLGLQGPILDWSFPDGSDGKESACNVRDLGSIPGLGRSPGEGNGYHSSIAWRITSTEATYSSWGRNELCFAL